MVVLNDLFKKHTQFTDELLFFKYGLSLLFCLSLLIPNAAYPNSKDRDLNNIIEALDINTHQKIELFNNHKPNLLSFFEPDCPWCYKQIKALKKFQAHCPNQLNIVLVGIHGKKQQLRQELKKTQSKLPAIEYTPALKKRIGKIAATPTNVFLEHNGKLAAKQRGLITFDQLVSIFADDCP